VYKYIGRLFDVWVKVILVRLRKNLLFNKNISIYSNIYASSQERREKVALSRNSYMRDSTLWGERNGSTWSFISYKLIDGFIHFILQMWHQETPS